MPTVNGHDIFPTTSFDAARYVIHVVVFDPRTKRQYEMPFPFRYLADAKKWALEHPPGTPIVDPKPYQGGTQTNPDYLDYAAIDRQRVKVKNLERKLAHMTAWVPPPIRAEVARKLDDEQTKLDAMTGNP